MKDRIIFIIKKQQKGGKSMEDFIIDKNDIIDENVLIILNNL